MPDNYRNLWPNTRWQRLRWPLFGPPAERRPPWKCKNAGNSQIPREFLRNDRSILQATNTTQPVSSPMRPRHDPPTPPIIRCPYCNSEWFREAAVDMWKEQTEDDFQLARWGHPPDPGNTLNHAPQGRRGP